MAGLWLQMAACAVEQRGALGGFAENKLCLARFFFDRLSPQTLALEAGIMAGPASINSLANDTI
ncbi:acyl-CoA dehydrogenase C-terminal domain-containing protein [Acidimangrovimonas pyrenivorans]|uniref:Acyl-CoA dehydrogenase C-terminal domain-containing protein n=1 Tax=Acidimangrovimonas pyrenivorans TaxID=2030798 RepID=A0ABV7AFB9_9RHOB